MAVSVVGIVQGPWIGGRVAFVGEAFFTLGEEQLVNAQTMSMQIEHTKKRFVSFACFIA